ncbi:MAG: hypothetical protein WCP45_11450, partial [Verrucomicrobiota bacterium]
SHAVTLAMSSEVLVGLAVTSHNNGALNTAIFDNVGLAVLPLGTSSWNSFQNTWFSAGQLANASLSAPDADPNHDGLANFFAYTSGISPWLRATTENGVYPIVGIQDGFLSITYTRLRRRFDFECIGEVSSDLRTWNSGAGFTIETKAVPLDDIREQVTVRDAAPIFGVDQRFMRLRGTFLP